MIEIEKELVKIAKDNMPCLNSRNRRAGGWEIIKDISRTGYDPNIRKALLKTYLLPVPKIQKIIRCNRSFHGNGGGVGFSML